MAKKNNPPNGQTPPNSGVPAATYQTLRAALPLLLTPPTGPGNANAAEGATNAPPPMPELDIGEAVFKEGGADGLPPPCQGKK